MRLVIDGLGPLTADEQAVIGRELLLTLHRQGVDTDGASVRTED